MVVKIWKAMFGGGEIVIYDPLFPPPSMFFNLRQQKNNQNQINTTGAQNLKEFSNKDGWLSVVFFVFFVMN